MQNKNFKKAIVAVVIFSMMAVYGSVPNAKAASLTSAKDTLSTSAPSVAVIHTVTFGTNITLPATSTIEVTLGGYAGGTISAGTCPGAGGVFSTSSNIAICTYATGFATSSSNTFSITAVNPAIGTYDITINTKNEGGTVLETAGLKVAIIEGVSMSASVPATLTFTVGAVNASTTINGILTTATSTATSTPFGNLVVGSKASVGQTLAVITNAASGYSVTVIENQDLSNAAGATIDSFIEGSATTTPTTWAGTTPVLDQLNTYGHLGVSTDDNVGTFSANKYIGLSTSTARTIMSHTGPADGSTAQKGLASVVYSVQVSALQEAGDYSNVLTYVCTPTY